MAVEDRWNIEFIGRPGAWKAVIHLAGGFTKEEKGPDLRELTDRACALVDARQEQKSKAQMKQEARADASGVETTKVPPPEGPK